MNILRNKIFNQKSKPKSVPFEPHISHNATMLPFTSREFFNWSAVDLTKPGRTSHVGFRTLMKHKSMTGLFFRIIYGQIIISSNHLHARHHTNFGENDKPIFPRDVFPIKFSRWRFPEIGVPLNHQF